MKLRATHTAAARRATGARSGPSGQHGMTLIELMVALLLGGVTT
jgi:prepilin-type N-terminal cleavage/methylation domain-containing protein